MVSITPSPESLSLLLTTGRCTLRERVEPQPCEVIEGDGDYLLSFPVNLKCHDGGESCMVAASNMHLYAPWTPGETYWVLDDWMPRHPASRLEVRCVRVGVVREGGEWFFESQFTKENE